MPEFTTVHTEPSQTRRTSQSVFLPGWLTSKKTTGALGLSSSSSLPGSLMWHLLSLSLELRITRNLLGLAKNLPAPILPFMNIQATM